jgi:hypothetical protein
MKSVALLLLTSSLCLFDINACIASENPLQEEQASSIKIAHHFTKEDLPRLYKMGLQKVLHEESKKDNNTDSFVAGDKMSAYPPVATEEGYNFKEYYMLGDGSCAKYAMGTTPQDAQRILLERGIAKEDPLPCDNEGNPIALSEEEEQERARAFAQRQQEAVRIRAYAHLEIADLFRDNPEELPAVIRESERYLQLQIDLIDKNQHLQDALIADWATEEGTFLDYVTHAFGAGVFTRYEQEFGGIMELRPYMIDALSYAMGMNLSIWQQVVNEKNLHNRPPLDQEQGTFVRVHNFVVNGAWPTAHLVHRGGQFVEGMEHRDGADHFNRLVPIDDHAGTDQALEDEKKHLSSHLGSLWDMKLLEHYRKAVFHVLYNFCLTDETLPSALKIQAYHYSKDLVEEYVLLEQNQLSKREENLIRVVMARAFALSVAQLERKDAPTERDQHKLLRHRQKQEALRRVGLELDVFSEDEIALMLIHLYQAASYERGFYRGYAPNSSNQVQREIAFEFSDALRALYLHEKGILLDQENRPEETKDFFKRLLLAPYYFPEDPAPEDFDVQEYLRLNPDIQVHATQNNLNSKIFGETHYKTFGRNEGRSYKIIPDDFDNAGYFAMNEDLVTHCLSERGGSLKEGLDFARHHYKEWGCLIEKRSYKFVPEGIVCAQDLKGLPLDFKPMQYLCANRDVLGHFLEKNVTFKQAIEGAYWHYSTFAVKENRPYK